MTWLANPLLFDFVRRSVKVRRLWRSSPLMLTLLLLFVMGAFNWGFVKYPFETWDFTVYAYFLTIGPFTTLAPILSIGGAMTRLRRHERLEPLLVTPLTARELTLGLLAPTVLGLGVFWTALVIYLASHYFPFEHEALFSSGLSLLGPLMLSGLYAVVQIFFCAAVTLRLSLAYPRAMTLHAVAALTLIVAPVALGLLLARLLVRSMDMPFFLVLEGLLCMWKLQIALVLIAGISHRFRDMCRLA